MTRDNPNQAVTELLAYESARSPFEGPNWNDATRLLAATVAQWPADGLAILDSSGGNHTEIVGAVVDGWSDATVDDDDAALILTRLETVDLDAVGEKVARMLSVGGQDESSPTEWHRFSASQILANRVWDTIDGEKAVEHVTDCLGAAINHPAGWITQFWLHAISTEWKTAGDTWMGLPPAIKEQLETMLNTGDQRAAAAEVIIASQLRFFYGADQDWCLQHVLPLLDWSNPARARCTWDGFLTWGRWHDRLLNAGLLNHYLAAAGHVGEFEAGLRRQLCQHLASIGLYSEIDPIVNGWVAVFTTTVDSETRTEWISQITSLLRELPSEAVEYQWQRWMRGYWENRLESIPNQLTVEEASAMSHWVVYLTDSMVEGATLAQRHTAGLDGQTTFLRDMTGNDRITNAPAEMAALVAHLLRSTRPPFGDHPGLRNVVRAIRHRAELADVTSIIQEAVRLGFTDAPDW